MARSMVARMRSCVNEGEYGSCGVSIPLGGVRVYLNCVGGVVNVGGGRGGRVGGWVGLAGREYGFGRVRPHPLFAIGVCRVAVCVSKGACDRVGWLGWW